MLGGMVMTIPPILRLHPDDDVAVAVARIDTGRAQGGGAGNMEQALQELRRFAERAGLYGRQP